MLIKKLALLVAISLVVSHLSYGQRGKDGDLTVSTTNNVLNTYTHLTADAAAGATVITVANNAMNGGTFTGNLAPGDLIMIIQMQGADVNNDPTFGNYSVPNGYTWSFDWDQHIETWGDMIAPWGGVLNSGNFEQVEVMSVAGSNTINLQCALTKNYTAAGHVQIVRIPRFNNLTVSGGAASIVPSLWDGNSGGIVALEVSETLDINAGSSISASEFGFRGGQIDATGQAGNPTNPNSVTFLGTNDAAEGSEKGEGIFGFTTEYTAIVGRYGISGIANGGGGGGYQNSGGGGGSNVYNGTDPYTGNGIPDPAFNTAWALDLSHPPFPSGSPLPAPGFTNLVGKTSPGGGRGGYTLAQNDLNELTVGPRNTSWGGDARKTNGGRGGHPIPYNPERLYFGGGGGAGDQDSNEGGSGGRGGGIVYIASYGNITGNGSIEVNGENGENSNPTGAAPTGGNPVRGEDGAGGGGAGGSIYIENANAIPATISLNAIGGTGGNMNMSMLVPGLYADESSGPGGGGTGGAIAYNSGTPSENITAGGNGVVTSNDPTPMMANFPPNGATSGHPGIGGLAAPYYDLVGTNDTVCAGQAATLSVAVLGTLPSSVNNSDIRWYDAQFSGAGGSFSGTGLTLNIPSPTVTTTYYVGICPGTFRIPVTVVVNPTPTLITTNPPAECQPNTVDITVASVTAGSSAGTLSYWTNNTATATLTTPTAVNTSGWYYIQLDAGGGCTAIDSVQVTINPADDASFTSADFCESAVNTISGVATPGGTYSIASQTGSGAVTINTSTGILANYTAGDQVTIQYTTPAGACQSSSTQVVNVNGLDDASFTTGDFCATSVNTISGVATPGGTFSIASQTGSGGVTINASTGVLANYVAGDQVTIQYTTPAGGCQNSSTQVVNVTNLDDASFTTGDFCVTSVNTISGVATAGGTFSISVQTGSGAATINASTGVLANFSGGDQVTIEYTTPAGGCQNSSTQVVNVNNADDASFTTGDFCATSVNTISGVATPGGTFSISVQTGSGAVTINASTGVLANFTAGDQVTIEYTTPAGGCQNSSTQVVNVNNADDASFTTGDFCATSVNTISGVATPGGTYSIASQTGSGAVTINASTGVLANYTAGDQVTIEYTTPAGGCQNSSTQVVNVTNLDDASFTTGDFCESAVNSITGVATIGGAFSIASQTGSGAATINATTGELSNFTAGDQITIQYTTPAGGCQNSSTQVVNVNGLDDASFTTGDFCVSTVNAISGVATPGGTYSIASQTGSGAVTINASTGILANFAAGDQITIQYTTPAGGCQNSSTQVVNVTNLDDASFTTGDFCATSVNTISGVVTPGGTYSIAAQTGSGAVTINASTGVLANFSGGDQITIEYTTPAGGCQNSSTQVVNVTNLDDASFTSGDFCESAVNVISGVVTAGGTYAIAAQTGSGTATINTSTGVLANFSGGDQITIEYTTPAGGCQNSSTQVVNVNPLDDATFTSADFCVSSTNVISGVVTAGGTFSIAAQTGSGTVTIDASTGVLSNFSAGDQITIEYTTPAGGCQNSSTQVVNVTNLDDASFTSADFCSSDVNTISGIATPGGTFSIAAQTGTATIDASTGVLSGFAAGDQITIEYTTPAGGCQNSSTQVVNVTNSDDASFTTGDFCSSTLNTISGVATPGGVFSIAAQTGSGAVTINASTGVLANFAPGDQVTIEYTTPAGLCQNSSTQVVNVLPADNPAFTLTPTCDGATSVITGTTGGIFSFVAAPTDGAVIDASTGEITNGTGGTTYSVSYATSGVCSASSTELVTSLSEDDGEFIMSATCDGAVVSGIPVANGLYSFATPPTDAAVIDASTGEITGGDQEAVTYSVNYTTTDQCPVTENVEITSQNCVPKPEVIIPTAFTPDNDGANDTWEILNLDNIYPNNTVRVYNRWGSLLFEHASSSSNPYSANMWDGTYKGKKLPVASYYFIIDHGLGGTGNTTGTVSIILNE